MFYLSGLVCLVFILFVIVGKSLANRWQIVGKSLASRSFEGDAHEKIFTLGMGFI